MAAENRKTRHPRSVWPRLRGRAVALALLPGWLWFPSVQSAEATAALEQRFAGSVTAALPSAPDRLIRGAHSAASNSNYRSSLSGQIAAPASLMLE